MNGWSLKAVLLISCAAGGYYFAGSASRAAGIAAGLFACIFALLLENFLRKIESRNVVGGVVGLLMGLAAAQLLGMSLGDGLVEEKTRAYILFFLSLVMGYVGLTTGGRTGFSLLTAAQPVPKPEEREPKNKDYKILDTSVIIDGRIADITETGFLEGTFVIPQFVLRELQHIADSSDTLKRNRGRRGLDILHKIQKKVDLNVKIDETDFPRVREVDGKLIALAKQSGGKIITNDFNLNKIAELQGVTVLNINQLANALKPVVLPGELMKVYILKEGKEANQGVAYLDDGTMVVVDNAKKEIGKTIEVLVTSVLQTTAGRMIFSQIKDESRNGG